MLSQLVNVHLWEIGEYEVHDGRFLALIDPDWIQGQLAFTMVSIGHSRTKAWATIDLAKVCTSSVSSGAHMSTNIEKQ